ncbi:transposase [Sodalis sp. RH21]|uniref:transposase n=1 Tax=unclassified Sodalis (in: enterobacteria) TaxID=2636512 RepID=UPI0039B53F4D
MPGANNTTDLWSTEARFAVIVEAAALSEAELSEYCRRKGLYPEQIAQWKQDFLQTPQTDTRQSQKQAQKEIKGLKRELARKELCHAGTAAPGRRYKPAGKTKKHYMNRPEKPTGTVANVMPSMATGRGSNVESRQARYRA